MELNKMPMPAQVQAAVAYLRKALPEADQIMMDDEQLAAIAAHALAVRSEVSWGQAIPEDLFQAYVLFPRVNNENLELYQPVIWQALRSRLAGKSMTQAILEVNYWCCENATYQATDGRTLNALSVVRRSYGRCGEESTLLVSALRACGIPARQIYVPRWAHCDDNHAWVEAWADGQWHYLGACEPEPALDSGWFTAAASKAMLVHTHAYGVVPAGECIEKVADGVATINRTAAYAQTELLTVRVTKDGAPLPGVTVRFELANYGEFFPIIEKETDAQGCTCLLTGLGTLHLHVHDGQRFVTCMVDVGKQTQCEIDFGAAVTEMAAAETFAQHPPMETRIQPFIYPDAVMSVHTGRLKFCEDHRAARMQAFHTQQAYTANACGNYAVIEDFLALPQFAQEDKLALLDTLRQKDFVDATLDMLTDALTGALPFKAAYPAAVWQESVLRPRVKNEMLYPVRAFIAQWFGANPPTNADALWAMLNDRITRMETTGTKLVPDFRAILRCGKCPEIAFDQLYVACARALGMAARLNPLTSEIETWADGAYRALIPARQADASLKLVNTAGRELRYGPDFTIAVQENGVYRTLWLHDTVLRDELVLPLFQGRYRVMTCTRQIDGAVDGIMTPVTVLSGEQAVLNLTAAPDLTQEKLVRAELPALHARTLGGEPACATAELTTGAIVALVAPGQEPTEHFFNELLEASDELHATPTAIRLILQDPKGQQNDKLQLVLRSIPNVQVTCSVSPDDELTWRRLMHAGDLRLPFATAVAPGNQGLFSFVNYHVGSVQSLLRILRSV